MAGKYPKAVRKSYSIEELAFKHLLTHRNDKSGGVKARMQRTYGRAATQKAIENASEILRMCDPNFR